MQSNAVLRLMSQIVSMQTNAALDCWKPVWLERGLFIEEIRKEYICDSTFML